ncbi:MAG: MnhB domain-containing protein [Nitrososphaerota archaeon]|nr:hypothetical protein [Nitrososphaerales archaeon]MDW8044498.1 MnhB domain-containing protein [Nitrososphaerota archaeon]
MKKAQRTKENIIGVALALILFAIIFAIFAGVVGYLPTSEVRELGKFYLINSLNIYEKELWAATPEAVTAIVWDYRGLDTLFETSVFFLAVIGSMAIFRLKGWVGAEPPRGEGLSSIVRVCVKIMFVLILTASASLAIHGQLTPGGGFQGGASSSIAPTLIIAAFSAWMLTKLGFRREKLITFQALGLIIITLTVFIPLILGGFLMQNQPKPWSGFPGYPAGQEGFFLGGSLIFYNIGEFFNIAAGFVILFILLSIPEQRHIKDISEESEK